MLLRLVALRFEGRILWNGGFLGGGLIFLQKEGWNFRSLSIRHPGGLETENYIGLPSFPGALWRGRVPRSGS